MYNEFYLRTQLIIYSHSPLSKAWFFFKYIFLYSCEFHICIQCNIIISLPQHPCTRTCPPPISHFFLLLKITLEVQSVLSICIWIRGTIHRNLGKLPMRIPSKTMILPPPSANKFQKLFLMGVAWREPLPAMQEFWLTWSYMWVMVANESSLVKWSCPVQKTAIS